MINTMKKTRLLLLFAVLIVLALTACGSKTEIDLKEVVTLDLSGVDGYGYAQGEIDEQQLYALVRPDESEEYNTMDAINTIELLSRIDCTLDRTEKLSNGDNVTVTVTYPDTLEDALDVSFTPKSGESWTVEITGLGEPEKIDVFENISLQYEDGNTLCAKGPCPDLIYTLSQTQHLHNGDTVTITVSAPDRTVDLDAYCMENYGWMPQSDTLEYTVAGIDEFPAVLEEIPEELVDQMRMVAQLQIESVGEQMASNYGDRGYQMNGYALEYLFVVSPRENISSSVKNEVYLVYRINASNPDGTIDYYYSAKFCDVQIRADGEMLIGRSWVEYPDGEYGLFYFGGDHYFCTGTEGEGFIGFPQLQDFYNWYLADWEDTWLINRYEVEE